MGKKSIFGKGFVWVMVVLMIMLLACVGIYRIRPYVARQLRLRGEQWYDHNTLIMHALGSIDGKAYTNSKEALRNSYQNGERFLECDFSMTADGKIAACHDWDFWYSWEHADKNAGGYVPTLEEFMNTPVMGGYTALSGEDLIAFMKEHPDVYIITDSKDGNPATCGEPFRAFVELAEQGGCREVLDRLIVQIYHKEMYEVVNRIYAFPNYIFTLYQEDFRGEEEKLEEYAKFCRSHNIDVITMWSDLYQERLGEIAANYDLQIFVHTVNEEEAIEGFLEKNVGVYTDRVGLSLGNRPQSLIPVYLK